jgi:Ca2+-binding EF-hand superfamily protein
MQLNQQQQQQHLDMRQQESGGGERAGSGGGGKRFRGGGLWIAAAAATSVWVRSKGSGAHAQEGSFKEDVVRQYENRVRAYSTPEKIFLYFASVTQDEEKFMTAEDFIQSLMTPSSAPEDGMSARGGKKKGLSKAARRLFQMVDMNGDGLVSFHEYIFVTTVMSIPESRIRVAFDMFDLDGDQELDQEEFSALIEVFKAKSRAGAAARSDVVSTSNAARRDKAAVEGDIVEYPVCVRRPKNRALRAL